MGTSYSKNKKNMKQFLLKILFFYKFKNLCILHGHFFVMYSRFQNKSNVISLCIMELAVIFVVFLIGC